MIKSFSEIVVIMGGLYGFSKLFINWSIKKKEISFTKIQENKLLEAKEFFKSYQSLRISLESFFNQTRFGKHSIDIFNDHRVVWF